jgi:SAM-dependent methyltransferase/peptidoglycan hydrolase CwlO-like protein
MQRFRDRYLDKQSNLTILDIGGHGPGFATTGYSDPDGSYADLFTHKNWNYKTLNPANDPGVDFYVENAFDWQNVPGDYADVVISGQTFEHIDFFWITMLEIRRVLKPGGLLCIIAPSGGEEHKYPLDCYRFYADGMAALARSSGLAVLEVQTDYVYDGVPPDSILYLKENTGAPMLDMHTGCQFGDSMLIAQKSPLLPDTEKLLHSLHQNHVLVLSALKNNAAGDIAEKRTINRLPALCENTEHFLTVRLYLDTGKGLAKTYLDQNLFSPSGSFNLNFDLSKYEGIRALRLDILSDFVQTVRINRAKAAKHKLFFSPENCLTRNGWAILSNDAAYFTCSTLPDILDVLSLRLEVKSTKTTYSNDLLPQAAQALATTQAQLAGTEGQLATTQAQLAGTEGQLATTQAQLAGTEGQLATTQAQLAGTEGQLATTQERLADAEGRLTARLYLDIGNGVGETYLEQGPFSPNGSYNLTFDLSGYGRITALRLDLLSSAVLLARLNKANDTTHNLAFSPENCLTWDDWAILSNDASYFICSALPNTLDALSLEFEVKLAKTTYRDDLLPLAAQAFVITQTQFTGTEKQLAYTKEQLAATQTKLAYAEEQLAATQTKLVSTEEQFAAVQTKLVELLTSAQTKLASTEELLVATRIRLAGTEEQLAEIAENLTKMLTSLSWRVTAPLRSLAALMRKFL